MKDKLLSEEAINALRAFTLLPKNRQELIRNSLMSAKFDDDAALLIYEMLFNENELYKEKKIRKAVYEFCNSCGESERVLDDDWDDHTYFS